MLRKLAIAGAVLLLALSTLAVVWAGRHWPPPLLVLRHGLPGSQGPTGRVAVVDGVKFVEVRSGYTRVGIPSPSPPPSPLTRLTERLSTRLGLASPTIEWCPGPVIAGVDYDYCFFFRWEEVPERVWVVRYWSRDDERGRVGLARLLPIREATAAEFSAARGRWDLLFSEAGPPAFSLAPGEERLVVPYLVSGE